LPCVPNNCAAEPSASTVDHRHTVWSSVPSNSPCRKTKHVCNLLDIFSSFRKQINSDKRWLCAKFGCLSDAILAGWSRLRRTEQTPWRSFWGGIFWCAHGRFLCSIAWL
jgi:hypothetical protein